MHLGGKYNRYASELFTAVLFEVFVFYAIKTNKKTPTPIFFLSLVTYIDVVLCAVYVINVCPAYTP